MATYNERFYATKMVLIDRYHGTWEESSAASAQAKASGNFLTSDLQGWTEIKCVEFEFDLMQSSYASSKRLKSMENALHVYVNNASASISGGTPSGSAADADLIAVRQGDPSSHLWRGMTWGKARDAYPKWLSLSTDYATTGVAISDIGVTGTLYEGRSYAFTAQFTVAGIGSANKPYRDVVWEDIVPSVGGLSPTGGAFVRRDQSTTFTFSVNVPKAYDGTVPESTTTFLWSVSGGQPHTITVQGNSVTIPANTFPANSNINIAVNCTVGNQTAAVTGTVTTTDAIPLAPTNLVPQNVFLHNDEDNGFQWTHNSPNGTPQSRAELQWSADGATWSALASVTGSANYVTVPANTLTAGQKLWRVRTYNADDVAGEWSESVQIVLIGAPVPPAILELTTAPRAFVRWSSGDQLGWRVTFTDAEGKVFDSGEQYGDAREYRAEGFLADGQAHYSVAVANEYGWSVTEGDFTVENAPSGTISLSAQADGNEALLRWSVSGTFDALYLLRGGVPIANVTGLTEYRDRSANGTESYQVLGTVGANYTFSNETEVSVRVETMSIFDVDGGEAVELRLKRGSMPVVARSEASDVSYYHFSGQRYPTAYTDGTATGALSITVTLRRGSANELQRFAGKLCCLRDKTGWRGYGVLEQIAHSIDRLDDVTLSFALTDYDEAVAYE